MNRRTNESLNVIADALRVCAAHDLSLHQAIALIAVAASPGLSVNELADEIGVPQQTASRHLSVLMARYQPPGQHDQKRALVEQKISDADPRKRALYLSHDGMGLIRKLIKYEGN